MTSWKADNIPHGPSPAAFFLPGDWTMANRLPSSREFSRASLTRGKGVDAKSGCVAKGTSLRCASVVPVRSAVLRGVGGASWWANQQQGGGCRQIFRLRNSAAKKSRPTGGGDYSASSPSTPIRARRPSSSAGSRATATASAPFTTGSQAAPMRRCPSSSRCSATFSPNSSGDGFAYEILRKVSKVKETSA